MVRRRRGARGMTLIEVMVALLITTVGLLGALATVGVTVKGGNFARETTEASVLAQSWLEQQVSQTTGSTTGTLPVTVSPVTVDANGATYTAGTSTTGPYTITTNWSTTSSGTLVQRQVQVIVQWNDGLGTPHYIYAARTQDLK